MTRRKNDGLFSAHALLGALRSSIRLLLVGMAVLFLTYLASGITVIGPNEAGMVMRLGKLQTQIHPPGLLLAMPPPIDEVIKVPVKTVQEAILDLWSTSEGENNESLNPVLQHYSLTGDVNIIRARFVLRYQISDPFDYISSSKDHDQLRDAILYECVTQVLASMKVEDALTSQRYRIGQEAMRLAQEKISRLKLGLRLVAFEIQNISPPRNVVGSFQEVITAKLESKTMVEEANAYTATTLPTAQAEVFRTEQEADSYEQQIVAQAQGESAAFLAQLKEYQANPEIVRVRLLGEMRQAVLPQARTLSVMPAGINGKILLNPTAH